MPAIIWAKRSAARPSRMAFTINLGARLHIIGQFRIGQQYAAQGRTNIYQRAFGAKGHHAHNFSDFQRIAQRRCQRLAHIANHRGGAAACGIGRFCQCLCQTTRL